MTGPPPQVLGIPTYFLGFLGISRNLPQPVQRFLRLDDCGILYHLRGRHASRDQGGRELSGWSQVVPGTPLAVP
jgi:hypothetical protein